MLKRIWNWIVKSSENPEKVALTVKGVLTGLLTYVLYYAKIKGVEIAPEDTKLLIDAFGSGIVGVGIVISSTLTIYGLLRKIFNLLK